MNMLGRIMMIIALSAAFVPDLTLYAQAPGDIQYIKRYPRGHAFQIAYREGGPLYGTYFFLDVHFCSSGQYILHGQSLKQTILGNEQVNNWTDNGVWDVVSVQGHASLRYVAASGARDTVALEILPDGHIRPSSGAFMKRQGKAQCQ